MMTKRDADALDSNRQSTDQVRWSIDLRYMSSSQGFSWHKMGDTFEDNFPCFVAASEDGEADSFEDWVRKWERLAKL